METRPPSPAGLMLYIRNVLDVRERRAQASTRRAAYGFWPGCLAIGQASKDH